MTLGIISGYLCLLLFLGIFSSRLLRLTAGDYFLASRGIGPFMLLMSIFGTTMTAFALIGSTGQTYRFGIGVYGKMASWSGIVHSALFFLIGAKVWALGKKHGYLTQISFFRDRYNSDAVALTLFPVVVGFVILYILMGVMGAGGFLEGMTKGKVPKAAGMAIICFVVLSYVFFGGMRATAWANTMQMLVFMGTGVIAFFVITNALGGKSGEGFFAAAANATKMVEESNQASKMAREGHISKLLFLTYGLIPVSVGMFPHLFQHWLTAKKASNFKLTCIVHPLCIMVTWVPCILIGMWAAGVLDLNPATESNKVLGVMVGRHSGGVMGGIIGVGVLAAIMSSMDSQFLCISSMFTNDIVHRYFDREMSERKRVWLGRAFVCLIVVVCYVIGLVSTRSVFALGVWCFTGFTSLVPLVIAALYWKRSNWQGAVACILTVAALWLTFLPKVLGAQGKPFMLFGMLPVVTITAASIAALTVATLLTPPPDEALVEKFFPDEQSPSS